MFPSIVFKVIMNLISKNNHKKCVQIPIWPLLRCAGSLFQHSWGALEVLLQHSWGTLGGLFGSSWTLLGCSWPLLGIGPLLGHSWVALGTHLGTLGPQLAAPGAILRHSGLLLDPTWRLFAHSFGCSGRSWGALGPSKSFPIGSSSISNALECAILQQYAMFTKSL